MQWWNVLSTLGWAFGYYPKASKTCLVVRPGDEEDAKTIFHESGVIVTTEGTRHLGAVLGLPSFMEEYVCNKVDEWKNEVEKLDTIAGSQPHVAYAAFVHGTKYKWSFLCRTVPNCGHCCNQLRIQFIRNFPCHQRKATLFPG